MMPGGTLHRRTISAVFVALLILAPGGPGMAAETLRVRAGEHDGFSRIVLDLGGAAGWDLGRNAEGYVLKLAREDVDFDLSRVYPMIPRTRIADLTEPADGVLGLTLGCDCHAKAFVTASGSVVVDIADGPPAATSPFETPIALHPPKEAVARPSPHPDIAERPTATGWRPPETHFAKPGPDPRLALFWRGVGPAGLAHDTAGKRPSDITLFGEEVPAPAPATEAGPDPSPDPLTNEAPAPAHHAPEPASVTVPILPDPRVEAARNDLLKQLGRAAAQGLVEVDRDRLRLRGHEPAAGTADGPSPEVPIADTPPGVHSETSIDRDSRFTVTRAPVTATGGACIDRDTLDTGAWGDDRPAPQQIAERRAPLVGEFDRPSEDAVLALARLYLYLGFGAEARAVLTSFDVQNASSSILEEIGLILDGYTPGDGALAGMADCATPAAMWAVLARPGLPPGTGIDEGAVLRGFSALPPHLRRHLGPGLSERLLSAGATSSARAVRDAVARIPGDAGPALRMMDGRLSLAKGDIQAGEAALAPLASGNDPLGAEALILSIQSRLDRGEPVDHEMADAAAALAYERQDGKDGPVLTRLHILARGASGDFPAAFDAFHRWPGTASDSLRHDTAARLFAMLADTADERGFLTTYFKNRDLAASVADDVLRIGLAERLSAAGFGGEVRALLAGDAGRTEAGRILLARAALADFEPAETLMQIATLEGPEAMDIRAQAHAMEGDHLAAATTLVALGQPEPAARAAWRGGDWVGAAGEAPEAMRRAIREFGLAPDDDRAAAPEPDTPEPDLTGELAKGRQLLAGSLAARTTLTELLSATAEDGL